MKIFIATLLWASVASAQVVDRDMTLEEPTTTVGGFALLNLSNCTVRIADRTPDGSGGTVIEERVIPATAPTGGGNHTVDLAGKIGFTTVTSFCSNTIGGESTSVSLTRTFPGDAPSSPTLRD